MLTVSSAATATDLIRLTDIPDSVRGTNNANDPRLSDLIIRVSSAIPRYCGRMFAQQTYVEDVGGFSSNLLHLMVSAIPSGVFAGLYPGGPITSITSIVKLDSENSTSSTAITATDYQIHNAMAGLVFRRQGWEWTAQLLSDLSEYPVQGSERPLFRATYVAGFTCPNMGTPATTTEGNLPYDIRMAAVNAVVDWYHKEQRDTSVIERRMGDVAIRYASGSGMRNSKAIMGLPESALDLLEPWVRWD